MSEKEFGAVILRKAMQRYNNYLKYANFRKRQIMSICIPSNNSTSYEIEIDFQALTKGVVFNSLIFKCAKG